MEHVDVAALARSPEARVAFLERFLDFGEDDARALRESAALIGPRLPAILDALYDHLLRFDDTRRYFLGRHGEVDAVHLAIRKEHLTDWVLTTISRAEGDPKAFAGYLVQVALRHTDAAGDPQRTVPPRYVVALMGHVQCILVVTLIELCGDDRARLLRCAGAWTKMLTIQLEVFLSVIAPRWPEWDEAAR